MEVIADAGERLERRGRSEKSRGRGGRQRVLRL